MAWWAVYSEPQREFLARDELVRAALAFAGLPHTCLTSEELGRKGLEGSVPRTFLPYETVTERRPVRGGRLGPPVVRDNPLFSRYLFVEDADYDMVSRARGVFGVLTRGDGSPHSVPARDMRRLLDASDEAGRVSALDKTRLSLEFPGKIGNIVAFLGPLEGAEGKIESLDRLDTHGEVGVVVEMLGGQRKISVHHRAVGAIVSDDGGRRLAASAAR